MNWGLMGAIYAMFHAAHGMADYWGQTDWQAQNKAKNWLALWSHATNYGLSVGTASLILWYADAGVASWKLAALPLVIALPHAWMDRRHFLTWFCEKTKGWSQDDIPKLTPIQAAVRVHVSIHMDQKFHYACLLLTAAWLAWGVP